MKGYSFTRWKHLTIHIKLRLVEAVGPNSVLAQRCEVLRSQTEQVSQRAVEGRVKGKLPALVKNMGPDTGSRQLLKVSCRECQGDIHVHCPSTRRCSELRGETSRNGGPQLMTLQLT